MAEVKNQYIGLSSTELEREKRTLEAMIYAEKQKVISKDAPDLLRRQAAYLRTLDYNLSMLHKAERELNQQKKPSLDEVISHANNCACAYDKEKISPNLQKLEIHDAHR